MHTSHPHWIRLRQKVGNELCISAKAVLPDIRKQLNAVLYKTMAWVLAAFNEWEPTFSTSRLSSF